MRFLLLNHIQNAQQSLRSNRMRTALTVLGVMIGVASITAILALSSGASHVISTQIDALGNNIAVIRPGADTSTEIPDFTRSQPARDFAASTLTESDIARIKAIPHVIAAAPLMILSGTVKADSVAPAGITSIVATTPDFATISQLAIRDGQFFDGSTKDDVAVIGIQTSINVFGAEESIGKNITVRGKNFTVIGILKRIETPINYNSVDLDNAVLINLASGKQLNQGIAQIQQINVRADSVTNLNQAVIDINKAVLESHGGEADFVTLSGDAIAQPTSQIFYTIAGITAAVAGISLLVGGIGIMNIMLVSVAERTREIGIRKALGATHTDIIWQFLIESLFMGVGGGVAGYVVGYGLAFVIGTFLTFGPIITWEIAVIAIGVSVIIGTIFGIYPAVRASRKDPIESLRQYN